MNKITLKNFWKVFVCGLLIVAMMLVQIEDVIGMMKFWVALSVIIAVIIYILANVIKTSNQLNDANNEILNLKAKIRTLEVGKLEDVEKGKEK
jgi:magnesium-transporting ATPase (P-type)